jgi:hypothetical protein
MKSRLNFCLTILIFIISFASTTNSATYTFNQIKVPGATNGTNTYVFGINNFGNIVGSVNTVVNSTRIHGFLDLAGSFSTIDVSGAEETWAMGINNSGDIVGFYVDSASNYHGFLNVGGSFTTIDVLGALWTEVYGINDSGDIVGCYSSSTGIHGLLKTGESLTTIDFPGASGTFANGINNSGDIVGFYVDSASNYHGFLNVGGSFTTIDVLGTLWTEVYGINDSGDIVGTYRTSTGNHGFLKTGESLTTIDFPGASGTFANGINNSGDIAGFYLNQSHITNHGFLATANAPIISVTPMSNDYGNVKVKRSKTASFKVTNSGTVNLLMSTSLTGTDASMFKITGGSGSKTIKPGRSLSIRVTFKPTSTGAKASTLEITSNDPITPSVDIPLSGTGQ